MKTNISMFFLMIITVLCGLNQFPSRPLFAQPAGYSLFWSDEFNDVGMDHSKWRHRYLGPRKGGVNVESAVIQNGNGYLMITTTKVNNEYHVGMIGTQQTFQTRYGYFECRAKLQKEVGHWSAFWLQSPTMGHVGDPAVNGAEIDIYEYLRIKPNTVHHNIHWNGYGTDHRNTGKKATVAGVGDGWHTFGLEWTENEYIFYVDDVETWRTSTAVSQRTEYIILSVEVGSWAGNIADANLPDTTFFDYVRVYKKDESTDISPAPVSKPGSFLLYDNYPNPFNPYTIISYQLPESKVVQLKIYDVLGREITTLVNEREPAGKHSVPFHAVGLPSGTYFYRIETGHYSDMKSMMVTK